MKSHVPVMVSIAQVLLAVGWALLIGNLVFQALKSMAVGLGFEGEDPKLLFTRTFVFAFLLMASPQICEVGLSLTARIIELLEIPDAINVTLVDEGVFGSLGAAWLLVIIFGLIIMLKVFRLLLEIAERYVILAVLTMTAPLAFAMGGSKSTSEIFGGWCRMFGSMCTLMVTNVIFFKMLLSVLSNVPSGLDIIPWIVLVLTIVKVARKADAIITRIGLNPAITGDSLGRGFPGTLTYLVMRSATSHINMIVITTSKEERDKQFNDAMAKVMEQLEGPTLTRDNKERFKYEHFDYQYKTLKGYAGNQLSGGYKFPTGGGFYFSDSGGPNVSGSVSLSLPAPYNFVSISVGLGNRSTTSGLYVTVPNKTDYFKLYVEKEMEVRPYAIYKQNKHTREYELYDVGAVSVLYKLSAYAKKV